MTMKLTVQQYRDAITKSLSAKQVEILRVLYNFPNSSATAKELAEVLNYSNSHAANLQIGTIGHAIANHLEVTPELYYDGRSEKPAYFELIGQYRSDEGWEMEENLQVALREINPTSTYNTYLFVWNPRRWKWENLEENIEQVNSTGRCPEDWSCGNTKSIRPNDRIFLVRVGEEPKGIMAAGFVTSYPYLHRHWSEKKKDVLYVDIEFETLLNPDKDPILTLEILNTGNLSKQHWTPQASGISIRPELVDELEAVWFDFLRTQNLRHNPFAPINSGEQRTFSEGTANQVLLTRYERNPYARKACIQLYGYSCTVCNFNFEKHYGQIGNGFIHVHHLIQLANVGKPREIDPIKDLRPVCANCHAMLHRQNPPMSIEELKSMMKLLKEHEFVS
jgi:5-methylcytosine-specific restriction protein A